MKDELILSSIRLIVSAAVRLDFSRLSLKILSSVGGNAMRSEGSKSWARTLYWEMTDAVLKGGREDLKGGMIGELLLLLPGLTKALFFEFGCSH